MQHKENARGKRKEASAPSEQKEGKAEANRAGESQAPDPVAESLKEALQEESRGSTSEAKVQFQAEERKQGNSVNDVALEPNEEKKTYTIRRGVRSNDQLMLVRATVMGNSVNVKSTLANGETKSLQVELSQIKGRTGALALGRVQLEDGELVLQ